MKDSLQFYSIPFRAFLSSGGFAVIPPPEGAKSGMRYGFCGKNLRKCEGGVDFFSFSGIINGVFLFFCKNV